MRFNACHSNLFNKSVDMPELPEVEVTKLGLQPFLIGQKISGLTIRQSHLRYPVAHDTGLHIKGGWVSQLARRGKYLLLTIADEQGIRGWLIFHLGMSGTLRIVKAEEPPFVHDHIDLHMGEMTLRFRDPRRFGAMLWHAVNAGLIDTHPLFAKLGVEPLSPAFSGAQGARRLYDGSRGRRQSIKKLLLGGHLVVGVGNIYASESLFHARIDPRAQAGRISLARYARLAEAIRVTLHAAIARGGSSLRDFVASDGAAGYFQLDCMVYGRAGQPCRKCGRAIRQIVQGQRASFFCSGCQHV